MRTMSVIFGLALLGGGAGPVVAELWAVPLETVRISGPFVHVSREALEAAVAPHLPRRLVRADVDAIRRAAHSLPWIEEASVRRVWTGSLEIDVVERRAVASWQGRMLIEPDGSLFEPESLGVSASLPALAGPPDRHLEVLERYGQLDRVALDALQAPVTRLEMRDPDGWVAELGNGIVMRLGSGDFDRHLWRCARAFSKALGPHLREVDRIDLRYGHGFSVRWRQEDEAEREVKA